MLSLRGRWLYWRRWLRARNWRAAGRTGADRARSAQVRDRQSDYSKVAARRIVRLAVRFEISHLHHIRPLTNRPRPNQETGIELAYGQLPAFVEIDRR